MYEYIGYVLANYFNAQIGHSEEGAISTLREHLASSTKLAKSVRANFKAALSDEGFSWRFVFHEHGVFTFDEEAEAHRYAQALFDWIFIDG
ncbi:hypothetical protein [Pseudomonas nitroreducens]|uniref:hypothetical protein n=1 Tax=Pseudomonas nitroreducens TaxID=46680 RepID=UPI00209F8564|nr:hypothetical protein [Pseudomonas nitroreducens]MCP1626336.1 hypothetical protein [Pseudomonas nitroreducens]